jgi:predicted TIM-barrel fold metal-dependent hydrolase
MQVMPPAFESTSCSAGNLLANMDHHGVARAVVFSNGGYGYCNNDIALAVAEHPDRFRALALVDIPKGEEAAADLERFMDAGFAGMKFEGLSAFECAGPMTLADEALAPVWEVCHRRDAIVTFHLCQEDDINALGTLARRYPHIRMVVAHFGAEAVFRHFPVNWRRLLELAGRSENIWLETSSLTIYAGEQLFFDRSISLIEEAARTVGAEKVLWGSDYPCMTLYATYYQMIHIVTEGCKALRESEIESIMGKNAHKLFFSAV